MNLYIQGGKKLIRRLSSIMIPLLICTFASNDAMPSIQEQEKQKHVGDARTLRVAAVQMVSKNGRLHENLEHATQLINQAAQKGAEFILLPEFMATGYLWSAETREVAEPQNGPTVKWLKNNSKRLGVWLGASFLEAEGKDFFNTFVLMTPDGNEAGRVRKQTPAAFEACFFKGDSGSHIINTEIGKIGVGICYENQLAYIPQLMHEHSADLILMPHSAPTPMQGFIYTKKRQELYNNQLLHTPKLLANLLGIPAIMVNKCGPWQSSVPWRILPAQNSSFPGLSSIVDSDGVVKEQMQNEEGVIIADITLDPSRKKDEKPTTYGRWAWKGPLGRNVLRVPETLGRLSYKLSSKRKKKALKMSSNQ